MGKAIITFELDCPAEVADKIRQEYMQPPAGRGLTLLHMLVPMEDGYSWTGDAVCKGIVFDD